ncbi:hypothetical protein SCACP_33960 [Sporomusa carbonis]|uniref:Uma2 family endonuclease n=1 Tax=Sporomusa carbonis TaxID=3076075 RepID=UPI003A761C74
MGNTAIKNDRIYTYADYLSWPEHERWEIINGTAYMMAPPSTEHQRIVGNLFFQFKSHLNGKVCEPFISPFGVIFEPLATEDNITTVVEPDITVVCNTAFITDKGCKGTPDLIIEVLSRSTASRDMIQKRSLYEKYRVAEYWIVDPTHQIITRYYLDHKTGTYLQPDYFDKENTISPIIFPDLQIDLKNIFPEQS